MSKSLINSIYIKNFRNLEESHIQFNNKLNCIFGDNGNGKTNILEAIYYAIFRKSFRKNTRFPQLVTNASEKDHFILKCDFSNKGEEHSLALKVEEEQTISYLDNGISKKKPVFQLININPFDSFQFNTTNSFRRDWFNHLLSHLDENYANHLRLFNKALKMRNQLLQYYHGTEESFQRQIRAIDKLLAQHAFPIVKQRAEICTQLEPFLEANFKTIFNFPHKLNISYCSHLNEMSQDEIYSYYQADLQLDRKTKGTKRGAHLDDYLLTLDDKSLYLFGSVGQQKISYLSLLFAYVGYLEEALKTAPVLLIDDISGELDSVCWKNLLEYVERKNMQVFITTANENFRKELGSIAGSTQLYVAGGKIRELH